LLNKIISYDSYFIEKNNDGIFKIIGKQGAEELIVKPIFEEIENEIVKQISSAKYTIWIAVAWITSLPIGREIVKKHRQGVNVRIVVDDDDVSERSKVDFSKTSIENYKISPNNDNYKNLMHHKFCVIDFQKVITGSLIGLQERVTIMKTSQSLKTGNKQKHFQMSLLN
jgi:phosphatidylserine/phosphatidylglycerophosphate/cardiolipin synthase-like enzyme